MIIVKLSGGLGNQMFQYAAGRRLAFHHNVTLKLDLSGFDATSSEETPRNYALNVYNIEAESAQPEEVAQLCKTTSNRILETVKIAAGALLPISMQTFFKERYFHFDPAVLRLGSNVYLDGYWQSEKYFCGAQDIIRNELKVLAPIGGTNLYISRQIINTNSVSLHVRRGDYVTNSTTLNYHGLCSLDYYHQAVEYVTKRAGDPHLIIFSDDILWVREQLRLPCSATFVGHNGPALAYEDLRLISLCKHNIIANSSFSWWGAWLNQNVGKIVVAPKQWFNQQDISTKDLIPRDWHRI